MQDLRDRKATHDASVSASTGASPFNELKDLQMRVYSNIFLPLKKVTTDNTPEYVLRLEEDIRKTFTIDRRYLQI